VTTTARPFEVMGVVNVTPDSFSDGGRWLDPQAAIAHGHALAAAGAALLDVGGESTRPGAQPVTEDEELVRTVPVVRALAAAGHRVSIDTTKLAVAEAALTAGATYVNDVSAFRRSPDLAGLVADRRATCCLMHMRGEPGTMQDAPRYDDVVDDVRAFLLERVEFAVREGVREDRIQLDPGIGFGKDLGHNLTLLSRLPALVELGFPVVVGASRKGFLGRLTGRAEPVERVAATLAVNVLALASGARVFRVHDVAENVDALRVASATLRGHA
jgi:dihydropteroate synthase